MQTKRKQFGQYVIPSMIAMVGSSCYVLVDTLFIAHINDNALAALNIVLPIYSLLIAFGSFVAVGASTYYSILKAQNKMHEGSIYYTTAIVIGMAVSIATAIILMANKYTVAKFLGANDETLSMCIDYMNAYVPLSPFIVLQHLVTSFIRNDGDPKRASMAGFAGSMFNFVFDYFFIFTLNLGMFGAALATGLAPVVGLCVCAPYYLKKKNQFHLIRCKFELNVMKKIGSLGLPTLIQGVSSGIVTLVFNRQLLAIGGNMAVTAYGIIVNVSVVIQYLMSGVAEGVQPLVSSSYGGGLYEDIRTYSKYSIRTVIGIASVGMAAVLLAGNGIISVFDPSNNPALRAMTLVGMIIYFIGLYPNGLNTFLAIFFTSVESPGPSTLISILKTGIVIAPLVLILPIAFGLNGVWLSFLLSELLIETVGFVFFFSNKYIKKNRQGTQNKV